MNLDEKWHVTISNKELYESFNSRNASAIKDMCDILAFDAAAQQELATINEMYDSDVAAIREQADERMNDFCVTLTFKDRTLELPLCNMDTYDAFCDLLTMALNQIDICR